MRSLHDADQQTSQMLAPGRFLKLIQDRRDTAAAVANATTALTNGVSATHQTFVLILSSQAFEDRRFRKFEIFPRVRLALRRLLVLDCGRWAVFSWSRSKVNSGITKKRTMSTAHMARMSKRKRIGVALMACSSGLENCQSEYGEQNTDQRARDGEPIGNAPAGALSD